MRLKVYMQIALINSNDYLRILRNNYTYNEFIVLFSKRSLNNHEKIDKIIEIFLVKLNILLKHLITKLT